MKSCKECNYEKPEHDFYPRHLACKECTAKIRAENYKLNKVKISEKSKKYYEENSEKVKARVSKYRNENADVISLRKQKYYQDNKIELLKKFAERTAKFPEKRASYRQENSESIKNYQAEWQKKNPIKRRANESRRRSRSSDSYSDEYVKKLIILQKCKCAVCKISLSDKFEIDHVIPLASGGLNIDNNIQLLCPTCNRKKHAKDPVLFMRTMGFLL